MYLLVYWENKKEFTVKHKDFASAIYAVPKLRSMKRRIFIYGPENQLLHYEKIG